MKEKAGRGKKQVHSRVGLVPCVGYIGLTRDSGKTASPEQRRTLSKAYKNPRYHFDVLSS